MNNRNRLVDLWTSLARREETKRLREPDGQLARDLATIGVLPSKAD